MTRHFLRDGDQLAIMQRGFPARQIQGQRSGGVAKKQMIRANSVQRVAIRAVDGLGVIGDRGSGGQGLQRAAQLRPRAHELGDLKRCRSAFSGKNSRWEPNDEETGP